MKWEEWLSFRSKRRTWKSDSVGGMRSGSVSTIVPLIAPSSASPSRSCPSTTVSNDESDGDTATSVGEDCESPSDFGASTIEARVRDLESPCLPTITSVSLLGSSAKVIERRGFCLFSLLSWGYRTTHSDLFNSCKSVRIVCDLLMASTSLQSSSQYLIALYQ